MKKLILFCLVVATVFAEEPTKFADGAKEVAQKDAAQKDVAQKKAHRARFEDAVKGYEDAVKEEAQAQAEEARAKAEEAHARAAKKRSLRSMLQAKGGSDLFDEVIKRMEEQDRLLKEHTAEISSLKSEISSVKSNQIHCNIWGERTNPHGKRPITFKQPFKSTPEFAVSIFEFHNENEEIGTGFQLWVTWEKVGPSGLTLVFPDYGNQRSAEVGVQVIACGH